MKRRYRYCSIHDLGWMSMSFELSGPAYLTGLYCAVVGGYCICFRMLDGTIPGLLQLTLTKFLLGFTSLRSLSQEESGSQITSCILPPLKNIWKVVGVLFLARRRQKRNQKVAGPHLNFGAPTRTTNLDKSKLRTSFITTLTKLIVIAPSSQRNHNYFIHRHNIPTKDQ